MTSAALQAPRAAVGKVRRRLRERAIAARQLVGLLRHARRETAAALLGVQVVAGIAPVVFLVATSKALARLATDRPSAWWLVLAGFAFTVGQLLAPVQVQLSAQLARQVDAWCSGELVRLALLRAPLSALEDDRVAVELREASEALTLVRLTPGMAAEASLALVSRYLPMIGAVVLLAVAAGPWAGLLALTVAMVGRLGQTEAFHRWGRVIVDMRTLRRRVGYVRDVATGPHAAKEIRTLGLIDWLDERYQADHDAMTARLWRRRRAIYGAPFAVYAGLGLLATVAALAVVAVPAADDALAGADAGDVVATLALAVQAVALCARFGVIFGEADVKLVYGRAAWESMLRADALAAEHRAAIAAEPTRADDVPGPERELRLEAVTFAYPGADRPVLDGLDLVIPTGTSLAVVGANGAGKTTLVKLLTGLSTPTSGRVLADGVDVAGLDPRAWQTRFAVTFQDFVRYPTSLRENVAMNAVEHVDDVDGVRECLTRAGLAGLLEELDADGGGGLDVPLSRLHVGGRDLSGGQWQRVALARALFAVRHGAGVLILDEPTAALDARGEAEFYDTFLDLTRGVTSIVISHRFSTVRRAERIVVLDGGRVVEDGSHEQLLASAGRYAAMFTAQARRFAVGGAR